MSSDKSPRHPARILALSSAALAVAIAGVYCYRRLQHRRPRVSVAAVPPVAAPRVHRRPSSRLKIGLLSLSGGDALSVRPTAAARITDPATGKRIATSRARTPLRLVADFAHGQVLVKGAGIWTLRREVAISGGMLLIGRRRYPGTLRVRLAGTGLQLVNELDIEQYLEGVLPGELPPHFDLQAQKALAVAARTYALVEEGKHGEFDLCDRTCCQMYVGFRPGATRGLAAVRATRRQCLWYGPDLAYTFYSADCGGESTSVDEVPLRDKPAESLPYLCPVRDASPGSSDYCGSSPFHFWSRTFTREQLEAKLNADTETAVGHLKKLKVTALDASKRVRTVQLVGEMPAGSAAMAGVAPLPSGKSEGVRTEKTVTGWELRRAVGALALKSTRMTIDEPKPGLFRFQGSGFGHGLGLCQIGAEGMARQGFDYAKILEHYYPGTRLATLNGSTEPAGQGTGPGATYE